MTKSFYSHSLDPSLLTRGGFVLDVGCREFMFTRKMLKLGLNVVAMDADPSVEVPKDLADSPAVRFLSTALVGSHFGGPVHLALHQSLIARHLVTDSMPAGQFPTIEVPSMTITEVMNRMSLPVLDAVKLDCEGSEYEILLRWPGPVSKQISVEFHEHTGCNPGGMETYGQILSHLGQWYDCLGFNRTISPGVCVANFWDVTFVLRPPSLVDGGSEDAPA